MGMRVFLFSLCSLLSLGWSVELLGRLAQGLVEAMLVFLSSTCFNLFASYALDRDVFPLQMLPCRSRETFIYACALLS